MKAKQTQSKAPGVLASEKVPAISSVEVAGYKSIRSTQSIAIRPLTVLAGVNSSGKSSMIQPLLLLKQTLEAPYDPGPLLLDGPNVKFTLVDQMLFRGADGKASKEIAIKIQVEGVIEPLEKVEEDSVTLTYSKARKRDRSVLQLSSQTSLSEGIKLRVSPKSTYEEIAKQLRQSTYGRTFLDPDSPRREASLRSSFADFAGGAMIK